MGDFLKNKNNILVALAFLGASFFLGYLLGESDRTAIENVSGKIINSTTSDTTIDFSPFWKAWNLIDQNYVPTNGTSTVAKIDNKERVYGAIAGMAASLGDPYTTFFPPVETKAFDEEISGQIEGIGAQVDIKDGVLTVISPVKGTPAYRAGVKAGDKILKIDNTFTDKLSVDESIKLIRGKKGTTVKLIVVRDGEKSPLEFNIVRDYINLPTVDTELKEGVFIIRLYSFSAISPNLFRDAVRDFWESGNDKLIIDLRGNPGGYLEAAQDIASWFLPTGDKIVEESFKIAAENQVYRSRGYNVFDGRKLKLVILIDGGSASASEILAGALRDHGVATLVGTKSFGKGSVQQLFDVTDNPKTSIKITIAKWLTPSGLSISHQGLTPDIEVKLDEAAYLKDKSDNQLKKAIDLLNTK